VLVAVVFGACNFIEYLSLLRQQHHNADIESSTLTNKFQKSLRACSRCRHTFFYYSKECEKLGSAHLHTQISAHFSTSLQLITLSQEIIHPAIKMNISNYTYNQIGFICRSPSLLPIHERCLFACMLFVHYSMIKWSYFSSSSCSLHAMCTLQYDEMIFLLVVFL
jgi:hypothetical protein